MRGEAIRSIGIGGDAKALDALLAIYNAGDADVKEEVLQAWMIAGRKEAVYQAALNAKTEEEANDAIRMLGVMGATDELRKLGDRPNAARRTGARRTRSAAISPACARSPRATASTPCASMPFARSASSTTMPRAPRCARSTRAAPITEIKEAALQGMMIAGDEQGVLTLYRAAKTSEEKRSLMRMLSMMDGDAALQAIDAALEKK